MRDALPVNPDVNINERRYRPFFSHIYAEEGVWGYPAAQRIRAALPESLVVPVRHYKDAFCKKGQNFVRQKNSPKLILAVKPDNWHYSGSDMCDGFGRENFIYTADVMNCIYNCEYCYLKGMYNSANVVVFVDRDACFSAIKAILPAYICVSYDSDMLALEYLTGFTRGWLGFCKENPGAQIEIRTKSVAFRQIADIPALANATLAWTISPDAVITRFEKGAPSLAGRLACVREAAEKGWAVRVCIDPVVKFRGWRRAYMEMAWSIKDAVDLNVLAGLSIGAFRAPKDYYNKMRKLTPDSEILAYPAADIGGGMRYPDERDVVEYVTGLLA